MAETKLYEGDIKELILRKKSSFVPNGMKSTVVFEKTLYASKKDNTKTKIADALIFREDGVIFGIEIKTEYDQLSRLPSQLKNYSLSCDYVYVICHDKHVEKVEQILSRYKLQHVGIIAYSNFKNRPAMGVYKEPVQSPMKTTQQSLQMLWKMELVKILGAFNHVVPRIDEFKNPEDFVHQRLSRKVGEPKQSYSFSSKMTKIQLANNIIARVGEKEAAKILCDIFINNKFHPERSIKLHHFHPSKLDRGED